MLKQLITDADLLVLPIAGMLFFVLVFAAVLVRTLSRGRAYAQAARLPLDDDAVRRREEGTR
jgi:cbb3-type cytochrome oxidase subunit 3